MPRGVTHSTAEPVRAMSLALSASQRCKDRDRLRARDSLGNHAWEGTRGTHLDGSGAREHFLEAVEHLTYKVVRGLPHKLLEMGRHRKGGVRGGQGTEWVVHWGWTQKGQGQGWQGTEWAGQLPPCPPPQPRARRPNRTVPNS